MSIPKGAKNEALAYEFINFLLDPEIAARNANFVHYASPNATAKDKMDSELLEDPSVYPPQEVLDRCHWLKDRGADIVKIEKVWQEVRQ
jgi:spermidine/putrescine transport system substrate-binding protein